MLPHDWLDRDLREIACLAPLQEVQLEILSARGVRLYIKREDMLHPLVGGNKVYKLHGYLREVKNLSDITSVASFGGAHSNHILALAVAGHMLGIQTIGVIRGERPLTLSNTLVDAESFGMTLEFISREAYRRRNQKMFRQYLDEKIGPCFWIPEGGAGMPGAKGLMALAEGILTVSQRRPQAVFHACGTGSSVAGLAAGFAQQNVNSPIIYGVSVLKGLGMMVEEVADQIHQMGAESYNWKVLQGYHFGGYAKYPRDLAAFAANFERNTGIPLDPVYTSKMMWATLDLIKKDTFPKGSCLVCIHSGGLQGRRGYGLEFG